MFSWYNSLLLLNKYQGEAQASIKTECQAKASIFLKKIYLSVTPPEKRMLLGIYPGVHRFCY